KVMTSTRLNKRFSGFRTVMPRTIDIAVSTRPVVSRMRLSRLTILHLPGAYSGAKIDRFLQTVTSFIWALRHIDYQRWRAPPLLLRKRISSVQPRPRSRLIQSRDE